MVWGETKSYYLYIWYERLWLCWHLKSVFHCSRALFFCWLDLVGKESVFHCSRALFILAGCGAEKCIFHCSRVHFLVSCCGWLSGSTVERMCVILNALCSVVTGYASAQMRRGRVFHCSRALPLRVWHDQLLLVFRVARFCSQKFHGLLPSRMRVAECVCSIMLRSHCSLNVRWLSVCSPCIGWWWLWYSTCHGTECRRWCASWDEDEKWTASHELRLWVIQEGSWPLAANLNCSCCQFWPLSKRRGVF